MTVSGSGNWAGTLWELDQDLLHAAVARLDKTEITSVERNGRVRVKIQDGTAGGLATTIPAEDGWTAYVDGKKVETGTWLGTFLYVELPNGAREVELRYTAPGLAPGIGLGVLSGVALALVWSRRRLRCLPFFFGKNKGSEKRNV